MGKESLIDENTSIALEKVTQKSHELIQSIDKSIFYYLQSYINQLYNTEIGKYLLYTVFDIPIGNIIVAIVVFIIVFLFRKYFTSFVINILRRLAKKTKTKVDDIIVESMRAPVRFFFIIVAFDLFFLLTFIDNRFTKLILSSMMIIDLYWLLLSFIPAVEYLLFKYSKKNEHLSKELSRFIIRLIKAIIFMLGLISVLYNLGINVTAFIASLGLGGLAFALAAKDTVANLFGSIAIMMDGSIKVDDWIKVNGVEGIVEDIGMRTTKIRKFNKAVVAVPNSQIANSNIINYSRRKNRRINMNIGLTYSSTKKQIESVISDIREMLLNHQGIDKNQVLIVRFESFGASELNIFIYCYTNSPRWREYLRVKEDVNLKIMGIVEKNGCSFAFPSQSVYLEQIPEGLELKNSTFHSS